MSTIQHEIRKAIDNLFTDEWSETSLKYPNRTLDTAGLDEYCDFTIQSVVSEQRTLGLSVGSGEESAFILIFRIFTNVGIGDGRASVIADAFRTIVNRTTITLDSGGRLTFSVPDPPETVKSDHEGRSQKNITAPFTVRT